MAIVVREVVNKREIHNTNRTSFEELLTTLGFSDKASKIDPSKKIWSSSKISYLYIITKLNTYHVRLFSIENINYDQKEKQYNGERTLQDILNDV